MTITKEQLMKDIFKLDTPVTFASLKNFNLNKEVSITSKDILEKVQEMMYTGEWMELYNHVETEELVNDLDCLGLVKWPPSYVVYNIEKSIITIADDTTELNELLDNGYCVYRQYQDYGFDQKRMENYYNYMVDCAKQYIPHLYHMALFKSRATGKDLGDALVEILDEQYKK